MCPRARPRRTSPRWPPGCATGAGGGPTTSSARSTCRRRGPPPGCRRGRVGPGLRPRAAPVGGRGHPARLRRGPGEPQPDDGPGERAGQRGPDPEFVSFSEDVFAMATQAATHWDALAHCQPRRADLQRLLGVERHRRRRLPAAASTAPAPWSAGASCSTWPAPSGARCSSPATRSCPADLDAACDAGRRRRSSRATSCSCARARWCTSQPGARDLVAYTWPSPGPHHRDRVVVPRPRRRRRRHRHRSSSRSIPASTRTRTCRCTSCTWSRWG